MPHELIDSLSGRETINLERREESSRIIMYHTQYKSIILGGKLKTFLELGLTPPPLSKELKYTKKNLESSWKVEIGPKKVGHRENRKRAE